MPDAIPTRPIFPPATYVGVTAVAYSDSGNGAQVVSAAAPLPVRGTLLQAISTPAAGTASAATTAGPLAPEPGRALAVKLWGSWAGSAAVRSSIDGGATKLPLTVGGQPWGMFTGNVNEAELVVPTIAGETFYLDMTVTSGTLHYWMGQ